MNIYLAGPMRGLPNFNFPAFNTAAVKLRAAGHVVFNPAEHSDPERFLEVDHIKDGFKKNCIFICDEAEAIALLPGWALSKGALAERGLGLAIGIQVFEL